MLMPGLMGPNSFGGMGMETAALAGNPVGNLNGGLLGRRSMARHMQPNPIKSVRPSQQMAATPQNATQMALQAHQQNAQAQAPGLPGGPQQQAAMPMAQPKLAAWQAWAEYANGQTKSAILGPDAVGGPPPMAAAPAPPPPYDPSTALSVPPAPPQSAPAPAGGLGAGPLPPGAGAAGTSALPPAGPQPPPPTDPNNPMAAMMGAGGQPQPQQPPQPITVDPQAVAVMQSLLADRQQADDVSAGMGGGPGVGGGLGDDVDYQKIVAALDRYAQPLNASIKRAWQDNSGPRLSATGESKHLGFNHNPDDYLRGPEAWEATGKYLHHGARGPGANWRKSAAGTGSKILTWLAERLSGPTAKTIGRHGVGAGLGTGAAALENQYIFGDAVTPEAKRTNLILGAATGAGMVNPKTRMISALGWPMKEVGILGASAIQQQANTQKSLAEAQKSLTDSNLTASRLQQEAGRSTADAGKSVAQAGNSLNAAAGNIASSVDRASQPNPKVNALADNANSALTSAKKWAPLALGGAAVGIPALMAFSHWLNAKKKPSFGGGAATGAPKPRPTRLTLRRPGDYRITVDDTENGEKEQQQLSMPAKAAGWEKQSLLIPSWGGGRWHVGSGRGLGLEAGYSHLLGAIPMPSLGVRAGSKNFGISAGLGPLPYIGFDNGTQSGWQRSLPRSLWKYIKDKGDPPVESAVRDMQRDMPDRDEYTEREYGRYGLKTRKETPAPSRENETATRDGDSDGKVKDGTPDERTAVKVSFDVITSRLSRFAKQAGPGSSLFEVDKDLVGAPGDQTPPAAQLPAATKPPVIGPTTRPATMPATRPATQPTTRPSVGAPTPPTLPQPPMAPLPVQPPPAVPIPIVPPQASQPPVSPLPAQPLPATRPALPARPTTRPVATQPAQPAVPMINGRPAAEVLREMRAKNGGYWPFTTKRAGLFNSGGPVGQPLMGGPLGGVPAGPPTGPPSMLRPLATPVPQALQAPAISSQTMGIEDHYARLRQRTPAGSGLVAGPATPPLPRWQPPPVLPPASMPLDNTPVQSPPHPLQQFQPELKFDARPLPRPSLYTEPLDETYERQRRARMPKVAVSLAPYAKRVGLWQGSGGGGGSKPQQSAAGQQPSATTAPVTQQQTGQYPFRPPSNPNASPISTAAMFAQFGKQGAVNYAERLKRMQRRRNPPVDTAAVGEFEDELVRRKQEP